MISRAIKTGLNLLGWKTKRKIVVFEVDDYGLLNFEEPDSLDKVPYLELLPPFVRYDRPSSVSEMDDLLNILHSVKDFKGNSAIFTPLVVTGVS